MKWGFWILWCVLALIGIILWVLLYSLTICIIILWDFSFKNTFNWKSFTKREVLMLDMHSYIPDFKDVSEKNPLETYKRWISF